MIEFERLSLDSSGITPEGLDAADIDVNLVPPKPVDGFLNTLWHGPHYDIVVSVPDLGINESFKLGEGLYELGPGGVLVRAK